MAGAPREIAGIGAASRGLSALADAYVGLPRPDIEAFGFFIPTF